MTTVATERRGSAEGLECPICNCPESAVVWTRRRVLKVNGKVTGSIVRARECQNDNCRYRYQTNERVTEDSEPRELH